MSTRYYKEVDLDEAFSLAIKGLSAGAKDPYTVYYTPEEMKKFMEDLQEDMLVLVLRFTWMKIIF